MGIELSGPNMPYGDSPESAPLELIDVVFALSNVRLVREIVSDNIRQFQELDMVSKGQTEGLKAMITQKQKQVLEDLLGVEKILNEIVEENLEPSSRPARRNISLGPAHSKALIYALSFAISHLMKFIPAQAGSEVPGTII